MDDIRAVMDAVSLRRSTLFGISEGGTLAVLFAHDHPERADALILYGSWARRLAGPDYPYGPSAQQLEEVIAGMDRAWATGEWWDGGRPSPTDDKRHRTWWARYLRTAACPAMAGFSRPDEHAIPLSRRDSPACLTGAFEIAVGSVYATDTIAQRFRTGLRCGCGLWIRTGSR